MHRMIKHYRAGLLRWPGRENERVIERIDLFRMHYGRLRASALVNARSWIDFGICFAFRFTDPFALGVNLSFRFSNSTNQVRAEGPSAERVSFNFLFRPLANAGIARIVSAGIARIASRLPAGFSRDIDLIEGICLEFFQTDSELSAANSPEALPHARPVFHSPAVPIRSKAPEASEDGLPLNQPIHRGSTVITPTNLQGPTYRIVDRSSKAGIPRASFSRIACRSRPFRSVCRITNCVISPVITFTFLQPPSQGDASS